MTQANELAATDIFPNESQGLIKRSAVLLYGGVSYAIGVAGLLWMILAMGGLAPVGFSPLRTESIPVALVIDIGLILLFGLQHSVMARAGFKRWLGQVIPAAAERSTYVMMSGACIMLAIAAWQPLPGSLWVVENNITKAVLWTLYASGWGYLFARRVANKQASGDK